MAHATLVPHAVADIFPLMSDDEFAGLKADIEQHGLREPIVLHEGRIIDGRNRYQACHELKLMPQTKDWNGKGSLVSFIVSANLHRRHLTTNQRAMIAQSALPMLEAEAGVRKSEGQKSGGRGKKKTTPKEFGEVNGEAVEQAAELFGTNPHYVADAKRIKAESPELAAAILAGTKTIQQAKREMVPRGKRLRAQGSFQGTNEFAETLKAIDELVATLSKTMPQASKRAQALSKLRTTRKALDRIIAHLEKEL